MRIAELSVRNPQVTVVLFAASVALGIASWFAIPRSEDPSYPIPAALVVAVYPGATPTDLERLVVDPIEERIGELDQLKKLDAWVEDGLATIAVEFEADADAEGKYDQVLREVNALRPELPADLRSLEVTRFRSTDVNIIQAALVSETAPYHELQERADRLKELIEAVPGVRSARVWGAPEREVRVSLDLGRLTRLGIPPSRVLAAIGAEGANVPGGMVETGGRVFSVKTSGDYHSLDQLRGTVLTAAGGDLVTLRDVAEVSWDYADQTHIARHDGRRAVFVTATQRDGENVARVRDGIYRVFDEFAANLPTGIALERGFDQAANVSARLSRLGGDFVIALLLVLVTLLPLGTRASLVVMISIPLSLAIGVSLLHFAGFGVNQLSIVGFVIALGLLVDDSIVVVENITRFLREGRSRREAAIAATREIALPVVGCTATLILAFVPLLFLPGLPGKYIRSLPAAVMFTVVASLAVSLLIVPWLASVLLRESSSPEGNRFHRLLERAIAATYAPLLGRALARPGLALIAATALFAASLALVPAVGFSLFPKAGTPQVLVELETPNGSALALTDSAARYAERVLGAHPGVREIFTNVGRDNPQIYYNVIPSHERSNIGQLFVLLHQYDPKGTPAMLDSLRARLAEYPGARIELRELENGPPIDAPIAFRIAGPDLDTLRLLAARVERTLTETAGTQYVDNPLRVSRTDLRLGIDREKAGLLGIPTLEVDRTVRLGLAGVVAGQLREADGDERDIVVRLAHAGRPAPDALDRIYLTSAAGGQVPLRQVADLRLAASPSIIQHHDRERSVSVTSHVRSGFNTDRVTKGLIAKLAAMELPAGYRIVPAGEIESRRESFGGIGVAVVGAIFLILTILVLEFRTLKSTLIVMTVIPLGIIGALAALYLAGYTLSFTATVGFVALIGIEIKTSILLVDHTNQLRRQGMPLEEAVRRAGEVRFVPILLTVLTSIGGLVPLAVQGAPLYSPLAWVIIGGLVSSTLLARLVTPVMYQVLAPDPG